jgi:hypothetical protein
MIHLAVAAAVAVPAYILFVLASPVGRCLRCRGARVIPKGKGVRPCPGCKGAGRAFRPGAVRVHRLARELAGPWVRERYRAAAERRAGSDQ